MINALMLMAGAAVFFAGFYLGIHFDTPKRDKNQAADCKIRAGGAVKNTENRNFLNYDGTEIN